MKVTVLMPVYNAELYLKEAIESILNQTFRDFEFLIINDGSVDETEAIIKTYFDNRIRLISLPENKGIIHVLNAGLILAKGEYIARMDSDDIALPERLARQIAYLDRHPEVGVVGSWVKYIGAKNGIIRTKANHDEILWSLLFGSALFHPTVMLRSSVLKEFNFQYPGNFPHAEDYAAWIELSGRTKLANLNQVLLEYRWSNNQVTSKHKLLQKKSREKLSKIMHERLLKENIPYSDWQSLFSESKTPLNISLAERIYSDINSRQKLFNEKEFRVLLDNKIKALTIKKGTDSIGRQQLLKKAITNVSYFKYFFRSFLYDA